MKTCKADCDKAAKTRGFCPAHYARWTVYGEDMDWGPIKKIAKRGEGSYRGGGYRSLYKPNHPNSAKHGYIYEHVYVMSEHIGRPLEAHENVHHKNGDRADNHLENLELWTTKQPPGQRVEDKVAWAIELLKLYKPDILSA